MYVLMIFELQNSISDLLELSHKPLLRQNLILGHKLNLYGSAREKKKLKLFLIHPKILSQHDSKIMKNLYINNHLKKWLILNNLIN